MGMREMCRGRGRWVVGLESGRRLRRLVVRSVVWESSRGSDCIAGGWDKLRSPPRDEFVQGTCGGAWCLFDFVFMVVFKF
jgi:hypothetical protein